MSPHSDRRFGRARIAVIGATTPDGSRVRERLAVLGVPGSRVDLYGGSRGEAVISEYDGEARLIQEPDPGETGDHDVIFLCEAGEAAEQAAARARSESLIIDVVGSLTGEDRPPLVHMDINPEEAEERRGRLAVPHPAALLLAELLEPLERRLGLEEVVALVIRPAADFGEAGVEELRQQTVQLLSFAEIPVETFGRQLAFNLIPQAMLDADTQSLSSRICGDVARLLGWPRNLMTLRLLVAPVFFGHSLQLRIRTAKKATLDLVREALGDHHFSYSTKEMAESTPMDVSGESTTNLYAVEEDGLGGFWLLAVAGELGDRGAEQAVRIADSAIGL
jgi:aspartate-semialdehyde dehydrogenase